ncbi:sulfotransferase [Conexibacter stalactiti]|uniref:Sulfotransferase n=1 Tax=Conexibacter stalactiti TaxID=1940611 RepID=A0ABU4HLR0_9ACTN|nr:sulfotransferase [Conexibacter stalactiti]MDW5593662.1 sulfotransferase [Conexibacter stalactiti]MEC5034303.1 sulfotransferase [Conexibacter stalactiti]
MRDCPVSGRAVVVLGFHRSGTSMVTRMLNLLGVELGDERELLPPEERDNARGYWEPRWMNELNEELLTQLGSGTFAPFAPEPGWEDAPELEPLRERARTLLAAQFGSARTWGWKDPRTSLTLPFWRQLVDADLSFVICMRNPADAVASALKRGVTDLHRWSYAERWLDYTAAALAHTEGAPRTLVFYEDALNQPERETRRLGAFLGLEQPDAEQLAAAVESVDPELRHHVTNPLDVAVDPGLPVETRALYLLLRARRDLETPADADAAGAARDRLLAALDRIGPDLRLLHSEAARAAGEHAYVREQLEERDRRLIAVEQEQAAAVARAGGLSAQVERLDAELREREQVAAAEAEQTAARAAEQGALIEELHATIAARDAAITVYAESRSWRVTAPLRHLAGRVRARS